VRDSRSSIFYQKIRTNVKISRSLNIKSGCIYVTVTRKPITCRFWSAIKI